jgi:hypothetical protein
MFNEGRTTYTAADIRFTTKGDTLYAFLMGWPGQESGRDQGAGHQFSATPGTENRARSPCLATTGAWIGSRTKPV